MMERNGEKSFNELYADALSDCPSDFEINCSDSENDALSEDSDESDIKPLNRQNRNVIVSDSDNDLEEEWNGNNITPTLEDYLNIPGVTTELGDAPSFSEVTALLFDNGFFYLVVTQTNLYHSQMKELHKSPAKTIPWTEVTTNEIKKFLGLLILMGQTNKSHWKDYWSTDPLVEAPIFRRTMSRMRFEQILTFFYLNDNTQNTSIGDRLCKIT
ncbi:PREDICTED: piggyBac transposable element-derived protein 2-like [Dinoponera quadriceps]|uniref:PiggyBac transposable element-derived protein 2-like n=1 Tax=Dinoponera quadriceps TaxID=609295 RepID=A0A6P3Y038_DINQU|nr:PREDICTED: piggyBac transposable element-derived protein 2-like [Dinoponera quadriceps]